MKKLLLKSWSLLARRGMPCKTTGVLLLGVASILSSFFLSEYIRQANSVSLVNKLSTSIVYDTSAVNQEYTLKASDSNTSREDIALANEESGPVTDAASQSKNEVLVASNANASVPKDALSRGGSAPVSSKVELLDWWKAAQYSFPVGSTAVVRDYYTGKTFSIKRTMGTNHADCEALTLEDTKIIKSIWGGFSWTARPVYILINGRVLAASMSAMPHAGIDSAPAFAVVNNRSEGYGKGENLDVVKGNGMDGHFDVHFLNSTRHKDGKVTPEHQAAIKIAAGK